MKPERKAYSYRIAFKNTHTEKQYTPELRHLAPVFASSRKAAHAHYRCDNQYLCRTLYDHYAQKVFSAVSLRDEYGKPCARLLHRALYCHYGRAGIQGREASFPEWQDYALDEEQADQPVPTGICDEPDEAPGAFRLCDERSGSQ